MKDKRTPGGDKQVIICRQMRGCTTIFQYGLDIVLAGIFCLSVGACSPGDTNNYLTSAGADKKLPDDDGYTGSGGTGDGGGGQGILCSDKVKNPKLRSQLFVRDIFEVISGSNSEIIGLEHHDKSEPLVSDEAVKILVQQLKIYFGPAAHSLEFVSVQFCKNFAKNMSFIDDNATLQVSQDANSPLALPYGCKIVQIAFWSDSVRTEIGGTLYVDKKRWEQLDQINRIALLAHEYFFKEARTSGFKNSDFVRSKIGQLFRPSLPNVLFSKWIPSPMEGISSKIPGKKRGFKYCVGKSEQELKAKVELYQYLGNDGKPYFVIPHLVSSIFNKSSLLRTEFSIDDVSPFLRDLLYLKSEFLMKFSDGMLSPVSEYFDYYTQKGGAEGIFYSHSERWKVFKTGGKIWQTHMEQDADNFARITIEYPGLNFGIDRGPLTKDEMIREIYVNIRNIIRRVAEEKGVSRPYEEHKKLITNAFLIIKKEIGDFLAAGRITKPLPKWTKALQEIETEYLKNEKQKKGAFEFKKGDLTSNYLLGSLVELLVDAELGYWEDLSVIHQQLISLREETTFPAPKPLFIVEKGAQRVSFSLECQNFNENYWSTIKEPLAPRMKRWPEPKFDLSNYGL